MVEQWCCSDGTMASAPCTCTDSQLLSSQAASSRLNSLLQTRPAVRLGRHALPVSLHQTHADACLILKLLAGMPSCLLASVPLQEYNEHVHVLLTTSTPEARTLLQNSLPSRVGPPALLRAEQMPRQLHAACYANPARAYEHVCTCLALPWCCVPAACIMPHSQGLLRSHGEHPLL